MEKRLLAAVGLSIAILLATQYLMRRYWPAPPPASTVAPQPSAVDVDPGPEASEKSQPETLAAVPSSLPETKGTRRELIIENAEYRAVVDTQGAVLKSFQLKKYRNKSGQPLELIPQKLPPDSILPLALAVPAKPAAANRANQAIYEVRLGDRFARGDRFTPPEEFTFWYRDAEIQVQKSLKFFPDPYLMEASADLWGEGRSLDLALLLGPDMGTEAGETESDFQQRQIVVNLGGSIERESLQKAQSHSYGEPVLWAGFDSKYFVALAIPDRPLPSLQVERRDVSQRDSAGKTTVVAYYRIHAPLGRGPLKLYFGPKDYDILNLVRPGLSSVIDYGWFSFIVKPLLLSLKFVHRFVDNWGLAIIILTLLISLVLFPIRYKQMVSMKKMQALQPKMRSIQDRYKKYKRTDPKRQEMNAEIMTLYKEHGVNPLGGCLPLLIQMPFLFAFYRMLDASIELRGAPFIFWIRDLSKMDPYYITPILMGATMVLQQKLTPQTVTDPAQARMMTLMPIVFTAMFLTLSSGLVLYFLFSNLFGVGLQVVTEKWMPVEEEAKGKKKAKVAKE
ncbi:MAG: membrane protein insertase YidC [Acidobacteria bacterium]|nr:membrane protein insertase YidC [Acidobacteriota bacterium]